MKKPSLMLAVLGTTALLMGPLAPHIPLIGADAAHAERGGNGGGGGGDKGGGNDRGNDRGNDKGGDKGKGASRADSPSGKSAAAPGKSAAAKTTRSAPATQTTTTVAAPAHPGKGKLASELKGLNAAHASATARANASPNSQVGRLATYETAIIATAEDSAALAAAKAEVERLAALGLDPLAIAAEFGDDGQEGYAAAVAAQQALLTDADTANDAAAQTELDRLGLLTPEDIATTYGNDGSAAYAEAVAVAGSTLTAAELAEPGVDAAATAAALAALGAEDLSPEALAYLHELLSLPEPVEPAAVVEPVVTPDETVVLIAE